MAPGAALRVYAYDTYHMPLMLIFYAFDLRHFIDIAAVIYCCLSFTLIRQ